MKCFSEVFYVNFPTLCKAATDWPDDTQQGVTWPKMAFAEWCFQLEIWPFDPFQNTLYSDTKQYISQLLLKD